MIHGSYQGNGIDGIDRGGFIQRDAFDTVVPYSYLYADETYQGLSTPGGDPLIMQLEESLLNSIISNYKAPLIQLDTVRVPMLPIEHIPIALFTDTTYFPGKLMLAYGWECDFIQDEFIVKMREVKESTYNIINTE